MFRLQCSTHPVEEAGDRCFPLISKSWCEWKGFVWHYLLFVQRATSEHRLGRTRLALASVPSSPAPPVPLPARGCWVTCSFVLVDLLLLPCPPSGFAGSCVFPVPEWPFRASVFGFRTATAQPRGLQATAPPVPPLPPVSAVEDDNDQGPPCDVFNVYSL